MTLWTCQTEWPESTVWIIGGGTSLSGADLSPLRSRKTIAINSSAFSWPWVDFLFFGDRRWYSHHRARIASLSCRIVSNSPSVREEHVLSMQKVKPPPGIVDDRQVLPMSWTSIGPAMNLAVHLGARRIVLLGADLYAAQDGTTHHHEKHPWEPVPNWKNMQLEALGHCVRPLQQRRIEVVNANPKSALPYWPKRPLAECLEMYP
jgi:hypothetical protein